MKLTRHNGRSGKDGVYSTRHNDRQFDVENSDHVDPERVEQVNAQARESILEKLKSAQADAAKQNRKGGKQEPINGCGFIRNR